MPAGPYLAKVCVVVPYVATAYSNQFNRHDVKTNSPATGEAGR